MADRVSSPTLLRRVGLIEIGGGGAIGEGAAVVAQLHAFIAT